MTNFDVTPYSRSAKVATMYHSTPMELDMSSNKTNITFNQYVYNNVTINQQGKEKKKSAKRAITVSKTTSNAIKASSNYNKGCKVVLRIIEEINMTKYSHKFKNYDLEKFKELCKLDLIAMGITRRQEVNKFEEAISKAKYGMWNL